MLYAKILRPPAHDAKLKSVDTSAAEKMEGVQIVKDGDLIAALHKYPDVAEAAIAKVKATYDRPEATVDDKSIFDHLLKVDQMVTQKQRAAILRMGKSYPDSVLRRNT